MPTALLITAKDLRQRTRDRSLYIVGFVAPFALAFIFDLLLGGVAAGELHFAYGVVDADRGEVARAFREEVLTSIEEEGVADVTVLESSELGRAAIDEGDLDAVFILPSGFSQGARAAEPVTMTVLGNPDSPIATQAAASIARAFAASVEEVQIAVGTASFGGAIDPTTAEAVVRQVRAAPDAVVVERSTTADAQLDVGTYYSASMAILFLFFTVQFGVTSYLEERRDGTLARLLAAPMRRSQILVGKGLTSAVAGLVSMGVLLGAATLLMGATFGDPLGVGALVVAGVLSAVAVVSVVAALARSPEQANVWQSIIGTVLAFLGGAFFPLTQGPDWLSRLTSLTPHAWFLRGLGELSAGGDIGDALPAVGAILAFAAVVFALAAVPLVRGARA